jgi:hypothetical protein
MAGLVERNQSGRREDLSNLIAVADAKTCPFVTMVRKGSRPTNVLFRWQVDDYASPKTDGEVDGKDVTNFENAAENRAELSNRLQLFRRTAQVSTLAEEVSDVAGVGSKREMARAKVKKLKEIKRDMEASFLSDNPARADNGVLGNRTRGLGLWIHATAQGDAVEDVPPEFRTPAASIESTATASVTEAQLRAVLRSIFEQTGQRKRLVALVGTALKERVTSFNEYQPGVSATVAAIRTFNQDGASKAIHATVDFYNGDFAELELIPDLWLAYRDPTSGAVNSAAVRNGRGYVIDPMDIELRLNKPASSRDLPDLGGGPRSLIEAIAGLQVGNPLNHGKFNPS